MSTRSIACLVPTRGDRPRMLQNCMRLLSNQTLPPCHIELVNDPPIGKEKDITYRYRIGLNRILEKFPDVEVIALIEDDDWYSANYLDKMYNMWSVGRPQIFGIGDTYYYHLGIKAHNHMVHPGRASAFSTLVTPALRNIQWPADNYPFVDIEMWKKLKGQVILLDSQISIGIKGHNDGVLFGGSGHNAKWGGYKYKDDDNMSWLANRIDTESFNFYKSL